MEGVSLLEYKDALLQAAWETGVRYMATNEWGASGMATLPMVAVEVPYRKSADACKERFLESLERSTGVHALVSVRPMSVDDVLGYSHLLLSDGEWVGDVG